jgi:DNA-binding transcriptional regulator/RsmH inhibitor MraZ
VCFSVFIKALMRLSALSMTTDDQRYKGFAPYKMDPKFRVSVQTAWRPEANAPLFLQFSIRHDMPVVKVLTVEAYMQKVELINQSDKTPVDKTFLLGKLAMLSREVTLNEQGKLLIPKDLSEKAGISAESEVFLAGRGNHFEIWSKTHFEKVLCIETQPIIEDDLGIF